ncbi:MAG TPA: four helix bundle protein [Longimicrobiales bacterium]|nr:four helix bundle protein [Longimicrobiales bacterium]
MAKRYRFSFKRLDVYRAAVEHFDWTARVVARMPKGPFKVIDQAVGASLSVMGNIGEAHGRDAKAGEIEQHYRYAQGSTFESATHLDAFSALGVITDEEYNAEEDRLARIAMMLTRLMQKQRRRRRELRRLRWREEAPATLRTPAPQAETETEPGMAAPEVSNPREARSARREAAAPIRTPARGARGSAATDGQRTPGRGRRGSAATEGDRTSQSEGTKA